MTDPAAPRTLGRYEILGDLGRGATSVVYRARDPALNRLVVLRVLLMPADISERERAAFEVRFLEEARRASLLSHPNLVATHDCGKDDASGALYVVQEYVSGTPLSEALVPGKCYPWDEALRLVGGVGQALQQVHATGLVHSYVRPSNILILESGAPRLADVGVARFGASRGKLSDAFGAPLYTSPEQAVGERIDAQTDVFALGAVAYRLVTGWDAFEAETPQKTLGRVIHDRPRPPSAFVPGVPPSVDEVLAKALAKSRKDRYAEAGALCDDVGDVLAARPPRHAGSGAAKLDTSRFLLTLTTKAEEGETTSTSPVRRGRRFVARGLVGLLALALVAGLELARTELEAPEATPAGPPDVEPAERRIDAKPPEASELPPLDEPIAPIVPIARLAIDFKHTLENGTLLVWVDGVKILERPVSGTVTRSLLGVKLRAGRLRQVVNVPPGHHEIGVKVSWGDDARSDTIAGDFPAGATRRLTAKVGRIGKRLSVEWE